MMAQERVLAALNFEKTDIIPIYDIINNIGVYQYVGGMDPRTCPNIKEASARVYKALGIDLTRSFYNPKWQVGAVEAWKKYVHAPADGWTVGHNDDTSWISRRPYSTLEDVARAMPEAPDPALIEKDFVSSYSDTKRYFDPDVLFVPTIGGYLDITYRYIGYELFCEGIYDDPPLMDDLMDVFFKLQLAYVKAFCANRLAPAFIYCDDIAFKTSLLFSPTFLREKYFPRLKLLFAPAKEAGIKVIFHSDGHLNDIIDDLLACGIDALNPLEKPAGMDIVEIRRKYPRLALIGGVDCSDLLSFGSKEDIRRELERIIFSIGGEGGLILGSTSEIHNGIPPENCLFLYDTIRELSGKIC